MHQRVNILGVGVSAIDMALDAIDGWIEDRSATFVCIGDVHGIMASQDDEAYRAIHSRAGMVTPDVMPVVWAARMMGYRHVRKVSVTDLMAALCDKRFKRDPIMESMGQIRACFGARRKAQFIASGDHLSPVP